MAAITISGNYGIPGWYAVKTEHGYTDRIYGMQSRTHGSGWTIHSLIDKESYEYIPMLTSFTADHEAYGHITFNEDTLSADQNAMAMAHFLIYHPLALIPPEDDLE